MPTTYFVEQKLAPLANKYYVYEADASGAKAGIIAFAQQKRFALKEQIDFYSDDTKSRVIFSVKAEKMMDIHGAFVVTDETGRSLGSIRKSFKSSLLRSTFEVMQGGQPYMIVQERSVPIAITRRLWGFVPFLGEIPFFLKFHFDFLEARAGSNNAVLTDSPVTPPTPAGSSPADQPGKTPKIVASYDKLTLLRDNYKLEIFDSTALETVGWQTFVAQAVMLDALQGR